MSLLTKAARQIYQTAFPVFFILLFGGALFWAKRQDPLSRKWFSLKTSDRDSFQCVAVMPKPIRSCPVIVYAHGDNGSLILDGNDLRQMAELGLAAVSLEYNQTNNAAFDSEFQTLLQYVARQKWADTNAIAWIGFSQGADYVLNYSIRHTNQCPQLLAQLRPVGLTSKQYNPQLKLPHCPILLIYGNQDEIFQVEDTVHLASFIKSHSLQVYLKILPNIPLDMGPDRNEVFRCIGEYCLAHLSETNAWQNYRSIAQWEVEAPRFWVFCIPAAAWAIAFVIWPLYHKPAPHEKLKLKRYEIFLRCMAYILAIWALFDTALHLLPLHFSVTDKTLSIARKYIVPPKERQDFEYLAAQSIWRGIKLKTLLTHAELANYNRELINWQLDETNYQNYVLSPIITGKPGEQLNWRRQLWEEFYPRIRHEKTPEDASVILVRHLRERVTIANVPNLPRDVPDIWSRQITDKKGFEIIYVAALRSVGVPSRLDKNGLAEMFSGEKWEAAPRPIVETFFQ